MGKTTTVQEAIVLWFLLLKGMFLKKVTLMYCCIVWWIPALSGQNTLPVWTISSSTSH